MSKNSSTLETFDYINKKNKLKRFNDYKVITNYFKNIRLKSRECIIPHKKPNNYLLTNNLLLYKQIGTKSVYGIVYKCKNINKKYKEIPLFTAKLQLLKDNVKKEIQTLKFLSNYAITYSIPNLPIIYKSIICNSIIYNDKYPKILANAKKKYNKYSLILNELASGDLYYFLNVKYYNDLTEELWKNTYEQIFICLAILHSLGINHNDSHGGNFLYHKIIAGGCFHYKINNVDFYIKNMGFLWTSWDYGLITRIQNKGSYIFDYMLINAVMRKDDNSLFTAQFKNHSFYNKLNYWGYLERKVNVPLKIRDLQYIIWDKLEKTASNIDYELIQKQITEDKWLKFFLDNNLLFSKVSFGTILSSVIINL